MDLLFSERSKVVQKLREVKIARSERRWICGGDKVHKAGFNRAMRKDGKRLDRESNLPPQKKFACVWVGMDIA